MKKTPNTNLCLFVIVVFIVLFAFISCKKDHLHTANENTNTRIITDSIGFGATEEGPAVYQDSTIDSSSISGYSDKLSYYPGDSVYLYLSGPAQYNATVSLKGMNNETVFSISTDISRQSITTKKPWVDGLGYKLTTAIVLPSNIKSGVYYWNSSIPLIVKSREPKDITVVFPSNTLNAYCASGGKNLYGPTGNRAFAVSFHRFLSRKVNLYNDAFLAWLNNQHYSVKYICDEDLDDYSNISDSRLLIISGHSEYWTRRARVNFDAFVNSGNNALVLSGNTMWWQVRYDRTGSVMVCYKDKQYDPFANYLFATVNWYTPSLDYPATQSLMTDFLHGGYGNSKPTFNYWNGYKIVNDKSPLFAGTNLKNGDVLQFPQYECDGALLKQPVLPGSNAIPVLDTTNANVYKIELLGYNFTIPGTNITKSKYGVGTFLVFERSASSGTVVNTSSETWCGNGFTGTDKELVKIITKNMIDESLAGQNLFTY